MLRPRFDHVVALLLGDCLCVHALPKLRLRLFFSVSLLKVPVKFENPSMDRMTEPKSSCALPNLDSSSSSRPSFAAASCADAAIFRCSLCEAEATFTWSDFSLDTAAFFKKSL